MSEVIQIGLIVLIALSLIAFREYTDHGNRTHDEDGKSIWRWPSARTLFILFGVAILFAFIRISK